MFLAPEMQTKNLGGQVTGGQVHHPIIVGLGGKTSEKLGSCIKMFLK